MRPRLIAATAAVLLLALTGCSAAADTPPNTATASSVTPTPTVEPSTAPSPAPLVAETGEASTDDLFLSEARSRLSSLGAATTIPNATDEQLLAAGHQACEQIIAQTPFNDVTVIEGEPREQGSYLDSAAIATAAILYFCPEMNGKTL